MADIELDSPHPGVTRITLNRPERLNAMRTQLVQGLHEALDQIAVDPNCRVVVLTGAGRGFCAGLDLGGYGRRPTPRASARRKPASGSEAHRRPHPAHAVTAAADHRRRERAGGGGGFALVLGSDIRIAATTARFNAAFIRIGLSACDIGTSWLLPRLVGAARAQELMLTGRIFDAEEAGRIGLVTAVVSDDALLDTVYAKADEIMRNTPFGVALTKEGMWSALEIPGLQAAIDLENRQQLMATATADHREAMQAFLEKRPPSYTNQ